METEVMGKENSANKWGFIWKLHNIEPLLYKIDGWIKGLNVKNKKYKSKNKIMSVLGV